MLNRIFLAIICGSLFLYSCDKNHAPVIEQFINDSDSVETGKSVDFEVIITDGDNDVTHCYWSFDNKLKPEYNLKTKIKWTAPNTPGSVMIKVEVNDGTDDTFLDKKIIVY